MPWALLHKHTHNTHKEQGQDQLWPCLARCLSAWLPRDEGLEFFYRTCIHFNVQFDVALVIEFRVLKWRVKSAAVHFNRGKQHLSRFIWYVHLQRISCNIPKLSLKVSNHCWFHNPCFMSQTTCVALLFSFNYPSFSWIDLLTTRDDTHDCASPPSASLLSIWPSSVSSRRECLQRGGKSTDQLESRQQPLLNVSKASKTTGKQTLTHPH